MWLTQHPTHLYPSGSGPEWPLTSLPALKGVWESWPHSRGVEGAGCPPYTPLIISLCKNVPCHPYCNAELRIRAHMHTQSTRDHESTDSVYKLKSDWSETEHRFVDTSKKRTGSSLLAKGMFVSGGKLVTSAGTEGEWWSINSRTGHRRLSPQNQTAHTQTHNNTKRTINRTINHNTMKLNIRQNPSDPLLILNYHINQMRKMYLIYENTQKNLHTDLFIWPHQLEI